MRTLLKFAMACGLSLMAGHAETIQFVQGGWDRGSELNVTFDAQDLDGDGDFLRSELLGFEARFGVPGQIEARFTLDDIPADGFFFSSLDNYLYLLQNSNLTIISTAFEGASLASAFDSNFELLESTSSAASSVPEPAGLVLPGLLGLVFWKRRKT